MLDLEAYLRRINYSGPLTPDERTLRELHRAHLLAVPFENLDIHLGREIVLDEEKVLNKIIGQGRGGFCYELNGAFRVLLDALGFKVTMLSAGVARDEGGFDADFDHMALLVELDARWLADVGFGDHFTEPLLLDEADEQMRDGRGYRFERDGEHLILHSREGGEEWKPQYRFTLTPRSYAEFSDMCRFHQTSPDSPFTRKRVCSLATPEGRITVSDMRLIKTVKGERSEQILSGQEEYATALREHFGIDLGRDQVFGG